MNSLSARSAHGPRPARAAVKRNLLRQIGRKFGPGDRLPSVRDLSRLLDVAHNTAYEAVRELAEEGLIELRARSGAFVTARAAAVGLAIASPVVSKLRVEALFWLSDRFIVDMFEGFQARALQAAVQVNPRVNPAPEVELDDSVQAAVCFNQPSDGAVRSRPDQALVLVATGHEMPAVQTARLDTVSIDQLQGGQIAGQAMRKAGVRDAFFVGVGDLDSKGRLVRVRETCAQRLKGFELGMGKSVPVSRCSYQFAYAAPAGAAAAERYIALKRPDLGVFCATDELALGFVGRMTAAGLRPGIDYRLIGFDGQARNAEALGCAITTVQVPAREMGMRAFDLLMDRLANPDQPQRRLLLGCSLRPGCSLPGIVG